MIREPVARRYAQALFEAAQARGLLELVAAELAGIRVLLDEQPQFRRLLTIPKIEAAAKRLFIEETFGGRVHPLVIELFFLLMEKKRMGALGEIIEGYQELLEAHQGVVRAEVTTAVPVPADLEERLVTKLEDWTGKKIKLERRIDPFVLGGMRVRMGDYVVDGSIRRALEEMRARLLEVPVTE